MSENENFVTVKYRVQKEYCQCCEQKLSNPEVSHEREFRFGKENIWDYAPWDEIVEDNDEFDVIVDEFVHETINFCAVSMIDKTIVNRNEINKVKQFILKELKKENE